MKKLNQKGFGPIEVVLIIVIVAVLGFVGYRAYQVYTGSSDADKALNYKNQKNEKDEEISENVPEKANPNTVTINDYTFTLPEGWKTSGSVEVNGNVSQIEIIPNVSFWASEQEDYSKTIKAREVSLFVEDSKNGSFSIDQVVESKGSKAVDGQQVKEYEWGDGLGKNYDISYQFSVVNGDESANIKYMEFGRTDGNNKSEIEDFRQSLREIVAGYKN